MRADFRSLHADRDVRLFHYVLFCNWFGETRPAGAAVELIERSEKGLAADDIDINAGAMVIPIFIPKGWLGPALLGDVILLRGELFLQLLGRGLRIIISGGG